MFRLGLQTMLFRHFFRFYDVRFDMPGLEIKYACEAAEKVGARLEYMGAEVDVNSSKRLAHETRNSFLSYIVKRWSNRGSLWRFECINNQKKLDMVGASAFSEKCMDQYNMNWYVACCATYFP